MAKEDLIAFLGRLLHTDEELSFLMRLDQSDLMTLISLIRQRVDHTRELWRTREKILKNLPDHLFTKLAEKENLTQPVVKLGSGEK